MVATAWIWTTDETPNCGSGRRRVLVLEKTKRYVRLRLPNKRRVDRISIETYERILLEEEKE